MLWHRTVGKGPNLVLLHGWAFNSDVFQALVIKYKKDYRITVIDLPGHGRSPDLDGGIDTWCTKYQFHHLSLGSVRDQEDQLL